MTSQRVSPALKVAALIAAIFVALPLLSIFVRAPWSDLGDMLSQTSTRDALLISLQTSIIAAVISCLFGVPLAWLLADRGLEDAARTMGASPSRVFFTIGIPAARPAIIAGLALAWARSLGEFGASITFAGSFPGRTQTLPMAVYELVSVDYRLSLVLSLVLIFISVAVLAAMRDRWMAGR